MTAVPLCGGMYSCCGCLGEGGLAVTEPVASSEDSDLSAVVEEPNLVAKVSDQEAEASTAANSDRGQLAEVPDTAVEPEAGGKATRRLLRRPALTMLADTPLADDDKDRLGFAAYADALALLVDQPETDTPLTLAISGEWGAGKTSLTNMVLGRLKDWPQKRFELPHIICQFNAWLHDDAPHLGAALAAEVAKTANHHRAWTRRLLNPLPSAMLSPQRRWYRRLLLGVLSGAVAVLVAVSYGRATKPEMGIVDSIRAVVGQRWAAPLAVVLPLLLVTLAIWPKVFAAAQAAARFVDDPRSEAATGSMQQVREQLGGLIRQAIRNRTSLWVWLDRELAAAGYRDTILSWRWVGEWLRWAEHVYRNKHRRRMVIVVDDLERCQPARAVEVCEVASQLLSHPDVVTILVANMSTVAAAAGVEYSKHFATESDLSSHLGATTDPLAVRSGTFGRQYLQKIIQIQFDLPPPDLKDLQGMFTSGGGKSRADELPSAKFLPSEGFRNFFLRLLAIVGFIAAILASFVLPGLFFSLLSRALRWIPLPSEWLTWLNEFLSQSLIRFIGLAAALMVLAFIVDRMRPSKRKQRATARARQEAVGALNKEINQLESAGVDVDQMWPALLNSEAAKTGGAALTVRQFLEWVTRDSTLRQEAESEMLRFLPSEPRGAKRMVNYLRLLLVISLERGMLGETSSLSAAHLGKWAVLLGRWPELSWAVRTDPTLMKRLEDATDNLEDLQAVVGTVSPQVVASISLAAFLKSEPKLQDVVEPLSYFRPAALPA